MEVRVPQSGQDDRVFVAVFGFGLCPELEITYTGLRPGEKLHEVLVSSEDVAVGKPHERLSRYRVPPLDPDLISESAVMPTAPPDIGLRQAHVTIDLTDHRSAAVAD